MTVDTASAKYRSQLDDETYFFCSERCRDRFQVQPDRYLNARNSSVPDPAAGRPDEVADGTIWTCPMHPQVRRIGPGTCPICGMALEPLEPSAEDGANPELIEMTRRFWISATLTCH